MTVLRLALVVSLMVSCACGFAVPAELPAALETEFERTEEEIASIGQQQGPQGRASAEDVDTATNDDSSDPESRNRLAGATPLPLSYVAIALVPLVLGCIVWIALYRRFSVVAKKGEPLLAKGEHAADDGFSPQQKAALVAVAVITLLLTVGVALAVALPGRVGAADTIAAPENTVSRAGGIESTWTAIAQRMGGRVTRPSQGKGCCCGRHGCHFGIMDVSGQCGRGARNVCASGTPGTRPGVLVHEVMHLYLWHANRFGLTRRTMMDEKFTDCLTKAVSGSLWTHYGCGSGLAEARGLLARFPPSKYPWGRR